MISELTDEFGSECEELLNERLDKINFIFFTSLRNFKRYLRNKYSYLVASKTVEFIKENSKEKNRLLLFDPFVCEEEYLDIHLRYEIRHSLTTSIQRKNNLDVVKCGNSEYVYSNGNLIAVNNEFYNELMTQRRHLKIRKQILKKVYIYYLQRVYHFLMELLQHMMNI